MPKAQIPAQKSSGPSKPRGLLELDSFTEANLAQWQRASDDLDELHRLLHYGTEPERQRYRPQLLGALKGTGGTAMSMTNWCRLVTLKYGDAPLSAAGSLFDVGGRFNVGHGLDECTTHKPWPAFYLAEDYETAFREKFQIKSTETSGGLSPEELALTPASHVTIALRGQLTGVFDLTSARNLVDVMKILSKVKMPPKAKELTRRLRGSGPGFAMLRTAEELFHVILEQNWRVIPVQFGLPARSQVLAELIRAAGFEAILYRSSKGSKRCLAVFPDQLQNGSFIELQDEASASVKHTRLDASTAPDLDGLNLFGN